MQCARIIVGGARACASTARTRPFLFHAPRARAFAHTRARTHTHTHTPVRCQVQRLNPGRQAHTHTQGLTMHLTPHLTAPRALSWLLVHTTRAHYQRELRHARTHAAGAHVPQSRSRACLSRAPRQMIRFARRPAAPHAGSARRRRAARYRQNISLHYP